MDCLRIALPPDFDLKQTVDAHGWVQLAPFGNGDSGSFTRVHRLHSGEVVRLDVSQNGHELCVGGVVDVSSEITASVTRMLQLDRDMSAFYTFCGCHPELTGLPEQRKGRMLISPTVWEDCVKVILTTNTTWNQTVSMVRRLVNLYGDPLPHSPELRSFPTPQAIVARSFQEFQGDAKLGYRAQAVYDLATGVAQQRIDLEAFRSFSISEADLLKKLLNLRGIGPYAAACILIYLGRYGRVNVDSWARMMVSRELGKSVTDHDVHQFFAKYGEYQGLVYHFYPWKCA